MRTGLAGLLAHAAECDVIGQVASGADLSQALEIYQPDVILWDLGWTPDDIPLDLGLEPSDPPIIALLSDDSDISPAWAGMVRGLLYRTVTPSRLVTAMQAVIQGMVVLEPEFSPQLPSETPPPLLEPLTPRELDVLRHLAEGLSNKAIARRLTISDHTVKFHVNAILNKLNAQSRTEAVVRATQLGLILL